MLVAWSPYILLVIIVSLWGSKPIQAHLSSYNVFVNWPGLHNRVMRMPPIVGKPSPYPAAYTFQWLAAPGTACFIVAFLASLILGMSPAQFLRVLGKTARRLIPAEVTMAAVLALAYLMNYSGATGTLGLAFAATGITFAFFSGWLGWVGVFLTGSDTSANALFGTLQTVTATKLGLSPVSMAAANSSGGVMGKMISLASIAVAATAVSMKREEEGRLFRFTIKHSLFLTCLVCLLVVFYCYVTPELVR
jgi:lactate permease